jgi:hypothetical protein
MKNETDEQIADQVLDLQPPMLTSKQEKQRNTQMSTAAKAFAEAIGTDAYGARDHLVNEIFARLQSEAELSWQEHAQLSIGLSDIRTRDGLLRMLHDAPELRGQFQSHLIREVTRAQQDFVAPLTTVYAGIAWLEGQSQLTRLAVDHALKTDSSYSLAQLLDIALRHNVPSTVWSSSLAAVSFDACLKGAA